jgi:Zn-dependent protease with chaperone function/putative ubiquitin-RnfH superfamily antitoxin RatB of RatAB toxin-antitoxin module
MSLTLRALTAVALMVGFYLLAVGVGLGLLLLPYLEWRYLDRVHIKLALVCVAGAAMILWSLVPRFDRFEPPGPLLEPRKQPRLFAFLADIAAKTGQAMPEEVYLLIEVNAWVAQRGGLMGFGSRRVMGIGLPLLQMLSQSRFAAVIAHEFGHYHGGDTRLGPWIHKTHGAVARTIGNLPENVLRIPFLLYANVFFRVTGAISWEQERAADALACSVAGSSALGDGLRALHAGDGAFGAYLEGDVLPVLGAGFRAPLCEGFHRFSSAPETAQAIRADMAAAEGVWELDPFDSHPPLAERLALAKRHPDKPRPDPDPAALTLLDDLPGLETAALAMAAPDPEKPLTYIPWAEAGPKVFVPEWQAAARAFAKALAGVTASSLPALCADLDAFAARLGDKAGLGEGPELDEELDEEEKAEIRREFAAADKEARRRSAEAALGAALAQALMREGWALGPLPGAAVLRKGAEEVRPFEAVRRLIADPAAGAAWLARCEAAGLAKLVLGPVRKPGAWS